CSPPAPARRPFPTRRSSDLGNASGAGSAQSVVLTDTLPSGLQFVSATTAPAVSGQVLTWPLGTLVAGDSGVIDLVLVVAPTVRRSEEHTSELQPRFDLGCRL